MSPPLASATRPKIWMFGTLRPLALERLSISLVVSNRSPTSFVPIAMPAAATPATPRAAFPATPLMPPSFPPRHRLRYRCRLRRR